MQFEGVAFARAGQAFNVGAVSGVARPLWRRYVSQAENDNAAPVTSRFFAPHAFLLPLPVQPPLPDIAATRSRIAALMTPPPGIEASRIYRPAQVLPLAQLSAPRVVIPEPLPEPAPVAPQITPAFAAAAVKTQTAAPVIVVPDITVALPAAAPAFASAAIRQAAAPVIVAPDVTVPPPAVAVEPAPAARPRGTLSLSPVNATKRKSVAEALKLAVQQDNESQAPAGEAAKPRETLRARVKVELPSFENVSRSSSLSQLAAVFSAREKQIAQAPAADVLDAVNKVFTPATASRKTWDELKAEAAVQPKKTFRNIDLASAFKKELEATLSNQGGEGLSAKSGTVFEKPAHPAPRPGMAA